MGTSEAKVKRALGARRIEAEFEMGDERFVRLSVSHSANSRALMASLWRERREFSCGLESRISAPFQDIMRLDAQRVARYSVKALEAMFTTTLATVERELADPESTIAAWAAEGTSA